MNHIKFFIYQFILFVPALVIHVYADQYISKPLTYVDVAASLITLPIFILVLVVLSKMYKNYDLIQKRNKYLLSGTAFILAGLFIGQMEYIWYQITGELIFS
ncbi:hypothetical protein GCM10010954_10500 [Halobacillus andaensis]|uniref:Uncharacterized protein n=1 Tax=Halobacillus andaensis TaxID=1176239 RepID=A0A917EU36_HALAA|nr:hypothetical protein [Halobacillus andaensis]MBP2003841.1 Mn2+/Fe2+ NRAMP family transporter [Halobacillus andaensis]GGF13666.1 hypothetical protein GCM10010954_10500 [Halobacillus andaensis]